MNYRQLQARVRNEAMVWQKSFTSLAKRYGLVKEFESKYLLFLNNLLSEYKDKFNEYNYSLIYKVDKNYRMSIMITDRQEKRLYCGISCKSHIDMQDFLERKLKDIKNMLIL